MSRTDRIWEKRESETQRAYEAFCLYRDYPYEEGQRRSLDAAYCKDQGCERGDKRASGHWQRWAADHDWKKRADAFDAHLELKRREELEADYVVDLGDFRDRQQELAQDALQCALDLYMKAQERLEGLEAEDIPATTLPRYFRAAAALAEAATDAEAAALSLHELMRMLEHDSEVTA